MAEWPIVYKFFITHWMFALDPLKAYSSFYTSFKLPEHGLPKYGLSEHILLERSLPDCGLPECGMPACGMPKRGKFRKGWFLYFSNSCNEVPILEQFLLEKRTIFLTTNFCFGKHTLAYKSGALCSLLTRVVLTLISYEFRPTLRKMLCNSQSLSSLKLFSSSDLQH